VFQTANNHINQTNELPRKS